MSSAFNEYFEQLSGEEYSIIPSQTAPITGNNLSLKNPSSNFLFSKTKALEDIGIEEEMNFVPLTYTQFGGVRRSYLNKSKNLLKNIPEFVLE